MSTARLSRGFVLGMIVCGGGAIAADATREATFGQWRMVCPESERCRVAQTVVAGAAQEPLLIARAYKEPEPVLVVSVPAGIYLAPGIALQIGNGKVRRYPFETCGAEGCHTGLKLDAPLLNDLKKGSEAKVSFFDGTQKVVTAVLSLTGFSEGYEALQ